MNKKNKALFLNELLLIVMKYELYNSWNLGSMI